MTKKQPDHDGPVGMRQWMEWLIIQGVAVAMAGVMMMAFSLSNDQSAAKGADPRPSRSGVSHRWCRRSAGRSDRDRHSKG